jgi:hypothetical protein
MAERKTKDARPGRVTPKGGPPKRKVAAGSPSSSSAGSGRYTAPIPREFRVSPWWVPALMVAFFGAGVVIILLNYLSLLGNVSNVYLFVGLGCIVAGFITSTRWH